MATTQPVSNHSALLTPTSNNTPARVVVDDTARLREIRALVRVNNQSTLDENLIICQIYMESRFDPNAHAQGSTAKGLMQLLRAPIRELYRIENLHKPRAQRQAEPELYREADRFHDGVDLLDEATNIKTGTKYLQLLIDNETSRGAADPISEAYKDYRGLRNGIYYNRIRAAADLLSANPESMQVLRDMVR